MKGPSVKAASVGFHLEDADLVAQCRHGDSAAFGTLVVKYQDRVFNTVWRMCGDRTAAEDLTQEAFVKALQSIGQFDGRAGFYTWLFRIAVNLTINSHRKARRTVWSLDATSADGDGQLTAPIDRLAGHEPSPNDRAQNDETHRLVAEALAELDEEHRTVVVLRDLESFGYDEIAEILNVPTGTVKSRLHRARLALRERLAPVLGMTC
jgi:RNA polymerase sigma-70 factor (ECF subfamily)